jgi:diaminopimelate decarboxylase
MTLLRATGAVLRALSHSWQRKSELRDLGLWDLEVNQQGHLAVQGLDTLELVARFGSPLLVVNKRRLMTDACELIEAFRVAPEGSRILYSYKTNCVPGILKCLHEANIGAEVISPYELWLADRLGVPGDMIVYNGVDKSDESVETAVRMGVLSINIDQFEEISRISSVAARLGKKANVGVRLALSPRSQFGLDVENGEALHACRTIISLSEHLSLRCLHVHLTSNAKDASTHRIFAMKALSFLRRLKDATGLSVPYLDLGGGFGVPTTRNISGLEYVLYRAFGMLPKPPRLSDWQPVSQYMHDLVTSVRDACARLGLDMPRLLIEPGRLVTSRAEFLLASVRAIKDRTRGPSFAITDAGRLSVAFPCDFEYHEPFLAQRANAAPDIPYDVMGRVCTSSDWMFRNRLLPRLQPGDVLAVMDAGAYFSSYSSNFAFPRPAIVIVDDGKGTVVRSAETFAHLAALDTY